MRYTIDMLDTLTLENGMEIVEKLRTIYNYNLDLIETYVEPLGLYDEVELVICSNGGEFRALSLIKDEIEKLQDMGIKIITRASSMAYSAGFYAMLMGDVRLANDTTSFMIHEMQLTTGYDSLTGNSNYLEHQRKIQDSPDNWVVSRTKLTKEDLEEYKGKDRWLTKEDCIKLGVLTDPNEKEDAPTLTPEECIQSFIDAGYKVMASEINEKELAESSKLTAE